LACALTITVRADDSTSADTSTHAKHKLTAEQKTQRKDLIEKYDTDKNGKLDRDEISKMSKEDKTAWRKLGGGHHKKKDASQ
ncbi:MAG TPA: hypothetical protein VHH88_06810, partial [Verrucomicrobiae bacterium]|nr:hypothetical protein [Verrucomicrobiae bacterium]